MTTPPSPLLPVPPPPPAEPPTPPRALDPTRILAVLRASHPDAVAAAMWEVAYDDLTAEHRAQNQRIAELVAALERAQGRADVDAALADDANPFAQPPHPLAAVPAPPAASDEPDHAEDMPGADDDDAGGATATAP